MTGATLADFIATADEAWQAQGFPEGLPVDTGLKGAVQINHSRARGDHLAAFIAAEVISTWGDLNSSEAGMSDARHAISHLESGLDDLQAAIDYLKGAYP